MDNGGFLDCFKQPQDVERWTWWMKNGVALWMKDRPKSHLELVLFVSKQIAGLKNGIGRKRFGKLIIAKCPEVVGRTDTPKSIKFNMDKYEHNKELAYFHKCTEGHPYDDVKELEDLYNGKTKLTTDDEKQTPTMTQRLEEYLRESVDEMRYAKVRVRPSYCSFTASFSVEQYTSHKFLDGGKPSYIEVYECVDDVVNEENVLSLSCRYIKDNRIKLYIVSTHGYDNHIYKLSGEHNVGLVRINPEYKMTENCYVLPRWSDYRQLIRNYQQMMTGEIPMTVSILIKDNQYITPSLSDSLENDHIAVRECSRIKAPVLTNDEIEEISYQLVKDKADNYEHILMNLDYTDNHIPKYDFDPYELAEHQGLEIIRVPEIPHNNLEQIDLKARQMYVSLTIGNPQRERFTVAHGCGHFSLHSNLGIQTFVETRTPVSPFGTADQYKLEWQANHYASCLLMPAGVVWQLYRIYWQKEFGPGTPQSLTAQDNTYFTGVFHRVVGPIARKLDVSMESMKWRLVKMRLINADDERTLKNLV